MSAHAHHHIEVTDPGPFSAPNLKIAAIFLAIVGAVGFGVAFTDSPSRPWAGLLIGMLVPTYLALAALFFISVNTVGGARWITPYRRIMEGLTSGLPITAVAMFLLIAFGGLYLYDWVYYSHPLGSDDDSKHLHLFHVYDGTKSEYMTWPRFAFMNIVFIAGWLFFRNKIVGLSLKQDENGEPLREKLLPWAIGYLAFFALSLTFFIWDFFLALQVNWFSTMWGVYGFTSAVQTFLCVMILLTVWLKRGVLKNHLHKPHVHDLATWLIAWSCFSAYIGFSQYMLIYYANIDEETYWYVQRTQHGYGVQYFIEMLLRWPLPFLGLMSQRVRTNAVFLTAIASSVIIANWMDWNWIVNPVFSPNAYRGFWSYELMIGAGFIGLTLLLALRFWAKHGIVVKNDPDLVPVVNGEHLH